MHHHGRLPSSGGSPLLKVSLAVLFVLLCVVLFELGTCLTTSAGRRSGHSHDDPTAIKPPVAPRATAKCPRTPPPPTSRSKAQPTTTESDSAATDHAAKPHQAADASDYYKIAVKVFTYKRLSGLKRLLSSLVNADYSSARHPVDLTIFVDYPKKAQSSLASDTAPDVIDDGTRQFVDEFQWPHGELYVVRRIANAGLKRTITESWYPHGDHEAAAFFEDDIEVAPQWFQWTMAALKAYAPPPMRTHQGPPFDVVTDKLLGISLYRPIHDELSGKGCFVGNENQPFVLQQPCSWGAVYLPRPWRRFRKFYDKLILSGKDVSTTTDDGAEPSSNTWDSGSSWKKYLIKLMNENGWFMVYPNLPSKFVFSTNHLMQGEHPLPNRKMFELPLLPASSTAAMAHHGPDDVPKSLQDLWAFDLMFRRVDGGVRALPHATDSVVAGA